MDDYDFFCVNVAQYAGDGNTVAQGYVWDLLGELDGAGCGLVVHNMVYVAVVSL